MRILIVPAAALSVLAACGDATGPQAVEEYAFELTSDPGVTIAGEVAAFALEGSGLLEVRELLGGTLDGSGDVWEATAMIRSALEGGTQPPPGEGHSAPTAVPVDVTVGDRTVAVVGLEFTFLHIVGGSGTVVLQGTVNGEPRVSGSASGAGNGIGRLVLGSVPGG